MNWAAKLKDDAVAVFLFHGVIPSIRHRVRNYTRKHITVDAFNAILDQLVDTGTPVSMDDLVEHVASADSLPPRSFAITFDDGFRNNHTVAAPILADKNVPATFYVTSDFIEHNRSSWIDLIEAAFEQPGSLSLRLPFEPTHVTLSTTDDKVNCLDAIRRYVKNDPKIDSYEFTEFITKQLPTSDLEVDEDLDRKMTWAEAASLGRHPLFTVGGHGKTHRILSYLTAADLETELDDSIGRLGRSLEEPVRHFSYPEGLAHCYSNEVIDALKRRGIVCSPTAEDGVNPIPTDLFRLKRIMVT